LEYLELEKTPDFTSPDFFHFLWPPWNSPTFPGFPGEWSPWMEFLLSNWENLAGLSTAKLCLNALWSAVSLRSQTYYCMNKLQQIIFLHMQYEIQNESTGYFTDSAVGNLQVSVGKIVTYCLTANFLNPQSWYYEETSLVAINTATISVLFIYSIKQQKLSTDKLLLKVSSLIWHGRPVWQLLFLLAASFLDKHWFLTGQQCTCSPHSRLHTHPRTRTQWSK